MENSIVVLLLKLNADVSSRAWKLHCYWDIPIIIEIW